MPQLEFATFYSQIFWASLSFLATFMIVKYLFTPRISKIISERQNSIAHNLNQSEIALAACRKIDAELKEMMKEARYQAAKHHDEAVANATIFLDHEIKTINESIAKKETHEFKRLKTHEAQIRADIPNISEDLAQNVLQKLKSLCNLSIDVAH